MHVRCAVHRHFRLVLDTLNKERLKDTAYARVEQFWNPGHPGSTLADILLQSNFGSAGTDGAPVRNCRSIKDQVLSSKSAMFVETSMNI